MKALTYLLIDIGCIFIPLIASFYPPHAFYKVWKPFFKANFLVAIPFLVWDEIFTRMGVWGFNADYLTGIYIGHLPLEEILFFICIPYACVFTHFAFIYLFPSVPRHLHYSKIITVLLFIISVLMMFFGWEKYYTFYTGFFLGILILYLWYFKINTVRPFFSYLSILPFFFISNGILTGSFLAEPIVWYNDMENLGIRLFTIPVEDSMYGLILIFLNILWFEKFRKNGRY